MRSTRLSQSPVEECEDRLVGSVVMSLLGFTTASTPVKDARLFLVVYLLVDIISFSPLIVLISVNILPGHIVYAESTLCSSAMCSDRFLTPTLKRHPLQRAVVHCLALCMHVLYRKGDPQTVMGN